MGAYGWSIRQTLFPGDPLHYAPLLSLYTDGNNMSNKKTPALHRGSLEKEESV